MSAGQEKEEGGGGGTDREGMCKWCFRNDSICEAKGQNERARESKCSCVENDKACAGWVEVGVLNVFNCLLQMRRPI